MSKHKYVVNGLGFSSQKKVEELARSILYKDAIGTDLGLRDFEFMLDYFKVFHRDWLQKEGVGIRKFYRGSDNYRKPCFWLERVNGEKSDISFIISKINKVNFKQEFSVAMRESVKTQIQDFKQIQFSSTDVIICPVIGTEVNIDNCHVDHHNPSFEELVKEFIEVNNIILSADLFPVSTDGVMHYTITDPFIEKQFYDFHSENANLRITSEKGNLTKKRK